MFFPILQSLLEVLVIVFAIFVYLKLSTIGERSYLVEGIREGDSCYCQGRTFINYEQCDIQAFTRDCANSTTCKNAACDLVIKNPIIVHIFMYYTFFEFLWLMFFITAFAEMVLAGVFAAWYWTLHKENVPSDSFSQSFYRTFR